ncbi:MAG TPA: hypothetical protein VJP40_05475, partial [bacterium]|nr:hypothetical protein [bacterium]
MDLLASQGQGSVPHEEVTAIFGSEGSRKKCAENEREKEEFGEQSDHKRGGLPKSGELRCREMIIGLTGKNASG